MHASHRRPRKRTVAQGLLIHLIERVLNANEGREMFGRLPRSAGEHVLIRRTAVHAKHKIGIASARRRMRPAATIVTRVCGELHRDGTGIERLARQLLPDVPGVAPRDPRVQPRVAGADGCETIEADRSRNLAAARPALIEIRQGPGNTEPS